MSEQVLNIYEYLPPCMDVYNTCRLGTHRGQQRALDLVELELSRWYGPSCVCWELNSFPLKEQKVFSLCISGQPRTCYAAKAGHEFIEIYLLLTPESWDSRCAHHARVPANIFKALTHMSLFFSERLNSHSHITCHKDKTLIGSRASWI